MAVEVVETENFRTEGSSLSESASEEEVAITRRDFSFWGRTDSSSSSSSSELVPWEIKGKEGRGRGGSAAEIASSMHILDEALGLTN